MYVFRVYEQGQPTDELVELDFEQMMEQDAGGFLTLPDGREARRQQHLEAGADKRVTSAATSGVHRPTVSFQLGVPAAQVQQFREDARANGFTDVEFVRCKDTAAIGGEFYDCKISGPRQRSEYIKHRGMFDRTGALGLGAGSVLNGELIERTKKLLGRQSSGE